MGQTAYSIAMQQMKDMIAKANLGEVALKEVNEQLADIEYNVKSFGADPTGATDSTSQIQQALDAGGSARIVSFPPGDYLINPVTKLKLKSNTTLRFSPGARLITNVATSDIYSMLEVVNVENIIIENPTIVGTRTTTAPTSEGAGHGISCRHVTNLRIIGAHISNCYTDGIYINDVTNGVVEKTVCDNNRRQGMSIISCNGFVARDSEFNNTNGTAPGMGVDIEPNFADESIKGLLLDNVRTNGNATSGIGINYNQLDNANTVIDVTIQNCTDDGSLSAITVTKFLGQVSELSTIRILDCKSRNARNAGMQVIGHKADGTARISFIRPDIFNPNTSAGTNPRHQDVAMSVHTDTTGYPTGVNQGNVEIVGLKVRMASGRSVLRGMFIGYNEPHTKIVIQDPVQMDIGDIANISANNNHNLIGFNGVGTDVKITDTLGVLTANVSINVFRNFASAVYSEYISSANIDTNMYEFARWDLISGLRVIKSVTGGTLTLTLPSSVTFIDESGTVITGTLATSTVGAVLSFRRIRSNTYKVVKEYGTWS